MPLVFIPGILGSVLEDDQGHPVWDDVFDLAKMGRLAIRPGSQSTFRAPRVLERFRVFGPFGIGGYSEALRFFREELHYQEGTNLFTFPYDWRQSNLDSAARFRDFVKETPALHGRFDIVAHSMGGLVASLYITEFGGDEHVNQLITVGSPFRGALKAAVALTEGTYPPFRREVRDAAVTFPSMYELLPTYDACCFTGTPETRDVLDLLRQESWMFVLWKAHQLPHSARPPGEVLDGYLDHCRQLRTAMAKRLPKSVALSVLASAAVSTPSQLYVHSNSSTVVSLGGDGTVLRLVQSLVMA